MDIKKNMEQEKDVNMKNNKQIREPSPRIFKSFMVLFGIGVAYSIFDVYVFGNYDHFSGTWIEFRFRIMFFIPIVAFVESFCLYIAHLFWSSVLKPFSETWAFHSLVILVLLNASVTFMITVSETFMVDFFGKSIFLFPIVAPFVASFIGGLTHRKK